MTDICSHPFFLSLEQAKNQTDNFESYFSSLREQQKRFGGALKSMLP
jgi:hypothetical protein